MYTPVGIYLRLRDRFRDTILLESTDHHAAENSFSFIGINAIGGIEVGAGSAELKLPGQQPEKIAFGKTQTLPQLLWQYMQRFEVAPANHPAAPFAEGKEGEACCSTSGKTASTGNQNTGQANTTPPKKS